MGENTNVPKPKPPVKRPEPKQEKKPFVRREHLTIKPFRNHPGLEALKKGASK